MSGGYIDLTMGKRTHFHECLFWRRDDKNKSLEELTHEKAPDGRFYARQENNRTNNANIVAGMFMFDNENIMLSTYDKIEIRKNDIVKYENVYWNVDNVQYVEIHKNNEFMRKPSIRTYLQLRR